MTKISIIIPVYNVSEYIGNCLDSILSQSLRDIEVICVNDGSSDNSAEILHKYEKSDNRIIVIDKENQGSGMARNAGLAIAKGKYILFVDGDDWLENNALEKIFKKAEEADTDILIFGGLSYYENIGKNGGYSASKLPKKYLNRIFSAKDIKKDIFKFPSTCWTKLYKKDFLTANNILFQDIKAGQDQLPFFHSMICAKRIALYPENIYCYRKNRCGAVTAVKKKNNFSPIYVFYAVEQLLNNKKLTEEYKEIL